MTNIALRSARDQAAAISSGELSATELLDITLERSERLNPNINAVIATQLDVARRRASDADEATARGESWGPPHGVPVTIKKAWDWVGSASTSGYEGRLDWRPERNSEAVQRLLDAGAVIYGKTNLSNPTRVEGRGDARPRGVRGRRRPRRPTRPDRRGTRVTRRAARLDRPARHRHRHRQGCTTSTSRCAAPRRAPSSPRITTSHWPPRRRAGTRATATIAPSPRTRSG